MDPRMPQPPPLPHALPPCGPARTPPAPPPLPMPVTAPVAYTQPMLSPVTPALPASVPPALPAPLPTPLPTPLPASLPAVVYLVAGNTSPSSPQVTASKKGAGRRSKFTYEEDLLLLREVAAAKAHVAPTGETRERFEIAAAKANATKKISTNIAWKPLQDRYKRLQGTYDEEEATESRMSGLGGEVGEKEELLAGMREDREMVAAEKCAKKDAETKREREKERLGAIIRSRSTARKASGEGSDEEEKEEEEEKNSKNRGVARRRNALAMQSEEASFMEALQRSDAKRAELEERKLELAREEMEDRREARKRERQYSKEDRDAAAELDLKKTKMMADMLAGVISSLRPHQAGDANAGAGP